MFHIKEFKKPAVIILIALYPILWLYNQKINYRSFFQPDRTMLLIGSEGSRRNLASVVDVMKIIKTSNGQVVLSPKSIATSDFGVLGRIIVTGYGPLEIYEYESAKHAQKYLDSVKDQAILRYKNLLIYNKGATPEIAGMIRSAFNNAYNN